MSGIVQIMKQADIFQNLTITQLELIAGACEEQSYRAGEIIFLECTPSDDLYVIAQGQVDIQVGALTGNGVPASKRSPVTVAALRRGQSFGEIALVDQGLRTATARATENNTRLLVFPREKLMHLCEAYPQLGYRLMRNLAGDLALKFRSADIRLREDFLSES